MWTQFGHKNINAINTSGASKTPLKTEKQKGLRGTREKAHNSETLIFTGKISLSPVTLMLLIS